MPLKKQTSLYKKSGIYALIDPLTKKVRYIGQAKNIHNRVLEHKNNFKNKKGGSRYGNWLRSLDTCFEYMVLELTENLDEREKYWIEFFNNLTDLVNTSKGGEHYPSNPMHALHRVMCRMFNSKSNAVKISKNLIIKYNNSCHEERRRLDKIANKHLRNLKICQAVD